MAGLVQGHVEAKGKVVLSSLRALVVVRLLGQLGEVDHCVRCGHVFHGIVILVGIVDILLLGWLLLRWLPSAVIVYSRRISDNCFLISVSLFICIYNVSGMR